LDAISLFGRLEGLILDPVYSGKAAAGLIGLVRSGRFAPDETVLFVHTGGWPGLYAYRSEVAAGLNLN
jgi:1-aminocyclopropane-1-carboxylate deaminase/D-cysteine desulfhydrase-like pyridoxal-dependent ACC family enzyme